MATALARPAHRRQGSDGPLPALGAATATVTLDGRLLEAQEMQQRGRQHKEEDGRGPVKPPAKAAVARPPPLGRPSEKAIPMTPPRVSGVSLAPLPNLDHAHHPSGCERPAPTAAHTKLQRRPSISHLSIGSKAPPPPTCNALVGVGGGAATGNQQLIAEGRSIHRGTSMENWMAAYLDINGLECDSVCATPPPRLSIQALARGDPNGAFGPLTPCRLSPSILTMCGQPGLDDHFALPGCEDLIDMRTCQSPKLPPV